MRISDWSSDVCSSDLLTALSAARIHELLHALPVVTSRSGLVISRTALDYLLANIPSLLAAHAAGLPRARLLKQLDRKSVAEGKSVSVRVDTGGCRIIKKKKKNKHSYRSKKYKT